MKRKSIEKVKDILKIIKEFTFTVFAFPALLVALIVLFFLPQYKTSEIKNFFEKEREYSSKNIKNIIEAYNVGSTMSLPDTMSCTKESLNEINKVLILKDTPYESKKILEHAANLIKTDFVKRVFAIYPEEFNDDFYIKKINVEVTVGEGNKSVNKIVEFEAEYRASPVVPDTVKFCMFFIASLDQDSYSSLDLKIFDSLSSELFSKDDVSTKAIGVNCGVSPFYKVMVNLKKKNFYKKNIKIRLIFSQLNQDFPFSMYEIHSNRYLRGIGEIELFFNFEDPVFVTLSKFEIKSSNLTSLSNEEIILVKDKIIGNAEDGYTRFAAKIQPTSNPILLTYSKYWNQEI